MSSICLVVAGQERSIPAPSEAAQSTKASGDLLRRFKELRESLRNEYSEPPSPVTDGS